MSSERGGAGEGSPREPRAFGLCPDCAHVRVILSPTGSRFLLCQRARSDARYSKYPPQPIAVCPGFERIVPGAPGADDAPPAGG